MMLMAYLSYILAEVSFEERTNSIVECLSFAGLYIYPLISGGSHVFK